METGLGPARPVAPSPPRTPSPAASLAASPSSSSAGVALVFAGASERDVALAKTFWNSVTLQPPLESRLAPRRESLGSGGGGGGAGSRRGSSGATGKHDTSTRSSIDKRDEERIQIVFEAEKNDVKEQYLKKAQKREEIIALLKKQREERIMKESFSNLNKSRTKLHEGKVQIPASDLEDQESVKALN